MSGRTNFYAPLSFVSFSFVLPCSTDIIKCLIEEISEGPRAARKKA